MGYFILLWRNRLGGKFMLKREILSGMICGGLLLIWGSVPRSAQQEKVVFNSDRSGRPEIYAINPEGSDAVRVTNSGGYKFNTSISSDGTKLALNSNPNGSRDIYKVNPDGSDLRRLTCHPMEDITPSSGHSQVISLSSVQFATVTFTSHRYDKKATASIGFDDCINQKDLISEMYMKQYNMQGTLFVIGKRTLAGGLSEVAQEIHRSGTLELACHTWSHTFPKLNPKMTQKEWEQDELAQNKAFLDSLLGKETTGFAYPWGGPSTIRYADVVPHHYLFGRTTSMGDTRYVTLKYPEMKVLALTEYGMNPRIFNRAINTGGWYRSFYHSWDLDWEKFSKFLKLYKRKAGGVLLRI